MTEKDTRQVCDREEVLESLAAILAYPGFRRSPKLTNLLTFLVKHKLEGQDGELKEHIIAQKIFNLPKDFNPRENPIVRVNISRLRALLRTFHENNPTAHSVQIKLPDVGYTPLFERWQPGVNQNKVTAPVASSPPQEHALGTTLNEEDVERLQAIFAAYVKQNDRPVNRYTFCAVLLGVFASVLSLLLFAHEAGFHLAGNVSKQISISSQPLISGANAADTGRSDLQLLTPTRKQESEKKTEQLTSCALANKAAE